jgi:hypothetical protein
VTPIGWRELWRLMLSPAGGPAPEPRKLEMPVEAGGLVETPEGEGAVPARFYFVVARTRLDLFLTIRRRFLDDRTVYVMLDRREQDRRTRASSVHLPERRRRDDRRRPRDYWEDIAHHPAVLIPLTPRRPDAPDVETPTAAPSGPKEEPTMDRGLVEEARVLAWVQESQHILRHVLPAVLDEREALRSQLREAIPHCQALAEDNARLRADLAGATALQRQLEQEQAEIGESVDRVLAQVTQTLGPMRELAERLRSRRVG